MSNTTSTYYTFLPWARRGGALQIDEPENFGTPPGSPNIERAEITVNVHLRTNVVQQQVLPVDLQIIGPGDVTGISKDVIVKTEPHHWITNFEPGNFAFIDFYEEDFPWRYSPAVPQNNKKLRPWLTLVVLKEDEFTRNAALNGAPLSSFTLTAAALQNLPFPGHQETWAWAHVHVNEGLDPGNTGSVPGNLSNALTLLNNRLAENPDVAYSRIICPRKLEENTGYTAFLVPTYETGRLAGLGEDPAGEVAQRPAWDSTAPPNDDNMSRTRPGEFPIYHEWYFRTGATGDFEYLVRQIFPRTPDTRVGRRAMDVQLPGYNLSYTAGDGTLELEGALRVPSAQGTPYPYPDTAFRTALADLVNLGENMLSGFTVNGAIAGSSVQDDPVVSPPLYGRWHALKRKALTTNNYWINELNLDPRQRVAAALGGDFVRRNQERLMDMAWEQVGAVIEANKQANWGQVVVESSQALYEKHIEPQPPEQRIAMTSCVHTRVTTGSVSVRQETLSSNLPEGSASAVFRRVRRPTGVLMKRFDPARQSFNSLLTALNAGATDPAPPPVVPQTARFNAADLHTAIADAQSANVNGLQFSVTAPGSALPPPMDTAEAAGFQAMVSAYSATFNAANWTPPAGPPSLDLPVVAGDAVGEIRPSDTLPGRYYGEVASYNGGLYVPPPDPDRIVPAMAAPSFTMPLYESVKELGVDFLIPNVHLLPQNSVTLLETNQKFIEAFMAGANYEMARELLWRDYPTDQRGTYFRHFWDSIDNVNTGNVSEETLEIQTRDITDIHQWLSNSSLGSHNARAGSAGLVLAIRGDLLKKFPNAVIYAVEADWQRDGSNNPIYTQHRIKKPGGQERYPVFGAKIEPDVTFLGFDLDKNTAVGNPYPAAGWFFVLMERPGEPRFGADAQLASTPPTVSNWNQLAWNHLSLNSGNYVKLTAPPLASNPDLALPPGSGTPPVSWADDASAMANIFFQDPVAVLIHAKELIP